VIALLPTSSWSRNLVDERQQEKKGRREKRRNDLWLVTLPQTSDI
jgi:hypothetical protein